MLDGGQFDQFDYIWSFCLINISFSFSLSIEPSFENLERYTISFFNK